MILYFHSAHSLRSYRKMRYRAFSYLAEWGLLEQRKNVSFRIGDTIFENVRVEKAYKGNYHLLCEVEGKERKFVITNKKEEYALIDKVGIDNLTDKQLCSLVETFFVR